MKIPTYDRFKNATFVLQKFTSLKNISKRTKLILLASAVSISVLTTGTVVFLSSSNSQNHSKHSYDIDKQNIPLAPSTKIATIELPERPLTSNNKKIIKSYDEQIKEIASIKSNHETVDKEISAQVQTQTNSAPSNFTASEHPQQTILPTTKDNFEAKQNLNNPREVTVTPAFKRAGIFNYNRFTSTNDVGTGKANNSIRFACSSSNGTPNSRGTFSFRAGIPKAYPFSK